MCGIQQKGYQWLIATHFPIPHLQHYSSHADSRMVLLNAFWVLLTGWDGMKNAQECLCLQLQFINKWYPCTEMKPVQQLESFKSEMDHSSGTACDIPHPPSDWGAEKTPPLAAPCSVQQPWPLHGMCPSARALPSFASSSLSFLFQEMVLAGDDTFTYRWYQMVYVLHSYFHLKTMVTVTDFVPPWVLLCLWMMAIQCNLYIDSHYHIFCGNINLICTFSGHLLHALAMAPSPWVKRKELLTEGESWAAVVAVNAMKMIAAIIHVQRIFNYCCRSVALTLLWWNI